MEDLHWVDASTLDLLGHLIDQVAVRYSGAVHVSARFPAALGHPLTAPTSRLAVFP
jgi:predicted ATPase